MGGGVDLDPPLDLYAVRRRGCSEVHLFFCVAYLDSIGIKEIGAWLADCRCVSRVSTARVQPVFAHRGVLFLPRWSMRVPK